MISARLIHGTEAQREFSLIKSAESAGISFNSLNKLRRYLVLRKAQDDFNDDWIDKPNRPDRALFHANKDLMQTGYIIGSERRTGSESLTNGVFTSTKMDDQSPKLRGIKSISINCGALFPAAAAAFLRVRERLARVDIEVKLDFDDINSHNQMLKARKLGEEIDFIMAADAAFFITSKVKFQRMLVIHGEDQWAFVRRGRATGANSRLIVFEDSTAHLQYKSGSGLPERFDLEWIGDGEKIPQYRSDGLDKGDSILVWSPLSYLFHSNRNFKTIHNPYKSWISIFGNDDWFRPARHQQREAFVSIFVEEWRICKLDMTASVQNLLNIPGYLERFSVCAGIDNETGFGASVNI